MTLCKLFGGLREIGSRYEDSLRGLVRAETAAEISNVGFTDGIVRVVFFRLYINAIKP